MPNFGSVQISKTLLSNPHGSILFSCFERRSLAVVKICPEGGTYWRGSSHILQETLLAEASTSYWAPHAQQIRRLSDTVSVGFGVEVAIVSGLLYSSPEWCASSITASYD